jgi:hypothetical protein
MKIPKTAWWLIAPLSWLWQYLVYVPAHVVWNAMHLALEYVVGVGDYDAYAIERRPNLRPWFIERLR